MCDGAVTLTDAAVTTGGVGVVGVVGVDGVDGWPGGLGGLGGLVVSPLGQAVATSVRQAMPRARRRRIAMRIDRVGLHAAEPI
jgi:hypothetical protein